jgi:dipeptidase E
VKKLVLYSDQIPLISSKIDLEMLALLNNPNPRIGLIPSSADRQLLHYNERREYYSRLGISLEVYFELDEKYHSNTLDTLLSCDAIHLSGGNTYYFLYWLRKRNMMDTLIQYVSQGGVLIGVSAGSILMTPDISTSALRGKSTPIEGETDYSGLNLVNFSFLPHCNDISLILDKIRKYSQDHQSVVYAAKDSGGIIVNDDNIRCIGDVCKIDER